MTRWQYITPMTVYAFEHMPVPIRAAIPWIAPHGFTDFDTRVWIPAYVGASLPMPSWCVTGVFCVASLLHLAADVGPRWSVALHGAVAAIAAVWDRNAAFYTMVAYLACVHTPAHYTRCFRHGRRRGLCAAFVGTIGSVGVHARWLVRGGAWTLTDWMQRVAIAHIVCEHTIDLDRS